MAPGKHRDLKGRIPQDVMTRALKAGVEHVDWYAGRLGHSDVAATRPTERAIDEQHKRAIKRHRSRSSEHRRSPVTLLTAIWTRAHKHAPHTAE
jgi:hypothetical protein